MLAGVALPLCGLAGDSRKSSAVAAVSAISWTIVLVQQGRTYDDRFECRHGCESGGCAGG